MTAVVPTAQAPSATRSSAADQPSVDSIDVLIVGAGPVGLATALLIAHRGPVTVAAINHRMPIVKLKRLGHRARAAAEGPALARPYLSSWT